MIFPLANLRRSFYKALRQPEYARRVFFRRLKAYAYYLFGRGKSSPPEAITLFLTHRCNLQCAMCGQWGEGGVTKKRSAAYVRSELFLDELRLLIDDVADFSPNITLFGGEPLLHARCLELIRYIKDKGLHCLMITNGSLLENFAQDLVESGLDELNLSLDGKAGLHDQIRGMPGLFDQIMRGLKKLYSYKRDLKQQKPLVNLQCTINRRNYLYLDELLEAAAEAHADSLTFHHLIFVEKPVLEEQKKYDARLGASSGDWEGFVFPADMDIGKLYNKLQAIRKAKHAFSVDVYPNFSRSGMREYYTRFSPILGYPRRCLSPWIAAYVFPDGHVGPCLNSTYSYGNIKKHKFRRIWNGRSAVKFRLVLKKNRIFPVCPRCTELYRY